MIMHGKQLFLFNTATRRKEEFVPVNDPVALYCCGPTVYNYAHIGNLRTYIFEDVLKRTLRALRFRVRHVVNITDVGHLTSDEDTGEDKMEKGAKREGKSVWEIAGHFTQTFMDDLTRLNILPPDRWPKATDHIPQMIDMVAALERNGFTYKTSDGIYFDTTKFPAYVTFAGLDPDKLRAGERVDMGEKKNVTDFALWKFSPADEKRQMEWDSPWGTGFPGWHIECSAMSLAYLPQPLDIHCGGADHIRVHHTNEIAQSEAATGKQFVRYWLHGEFLVLDKGKMAKSGDGFIRLATLREKGIPPLAYRMFCFTAHYRSPLSFSWEGLSASLQSLVNMKRAVGALALKEGAATAVSAETVDGALELFYRALCDDLNAPRAMAALWEIIRDESLSPAVRYECAKAADTVLALDLTADPQRSVQVLSADDGSRLCFECDVVIPQAMMESVAQKLSERKKARSEKKYTAADIIRKQLSDRGIVVKDQSDGSVAVYIPASLIDNGENYTLLT